MPNSLMKTTDPKHRRRRMAVALRREIRHYEKCLLLLPSLNAEVVAAGMEMFEDEQSLVLWLCEPVPALGGKVPLFVASTKTGRKQLLSVLGAMADGGYL